MKNNNYLIPVIPFHDQIISRGDGSYIFDDKGKKYLDLNSGQFCTILGHSNKEVVECVKKISETIVHTSTSMVSEGTIRTAKKINCISGDLNAYSILLSTGSEAVEFAIRYAKHITNKPGLVCFEKGYHGLTLGTQSITFGGKYTIPHVNNIVAVTVPGENNEEKCIFELKSKIQSARDEIAAVIMEPIVSVGGMIYPTSGYFQAVREICTRNNVLMILDESQTGFGRTGSWFCYQEMNVVPDMVVCSKGIGLGYPVSAVLFNGALMEREFTMTHYSSHQNDPFAAGVVEFGIDYITEHNLLERNKIQGQLFLKKLQELSNETGCYRNPRGHGMMLGLDLYFAGVKDYRPIYAKVYNQMAEQGVLIQGTDGGRVLRFLPDYLINETDMDKCINALRKVNV